MPRRILYIRSIQFADWSLDKEGLSARIRTVAWHRGREYQEMDLQLYFRVLWRFRLIVLLGLLLACVLSFLSFARVSFAHGSPKVSYRQTETWKATVLIAVTQAGFPSGYTVMPLNPEKLGDGTTQLIPRYADPTRFSNLAILYAPFVRSDAYQAMLRQRTHVRGVIDAQPVLDPVHALPEPFISLVGYADKPRDALQLANAGSATLAKYILREQVANEIPPGQRVQTQAISQARQATLATGRKKTTPIVVFLTVLLAAVGLSFVLENLRPRVRSVATLEEERPVAARRPA
jgi:hypothetical protein